MCGFLYKINVAYHQTDNNASIYIESNILEHEKFHYSKYSSKTANQLRKRPNNRMQMMCKIPNI